MSRCYPSSGLISAGDDTFPTSLTVPSTASAGVIITPKLMIWLMSVTFLDLVFETQFLRGLFRVFRQLLAFCAAGTEDLDDLHNEYASFSLDL
jgi:hypothetical protein